MIPPMKAPALPEDILMRLLSGSCRGENPFLLLLFVYDISEFECLTPFCRNLQAPSPLGEGWGRG